ncbi:MAG: hemerythrin domain-containing protein [Pseudomonadota bacterium]
MSDAIKVIRGEHRNLVALLACMKGVVRDAERTGNPPDGALIEAMLDYLANYLNQYHHPKETRFLFPVLRRRHQGSIGVLAELEEEHDEVAGQIEALRGLLAACQDGDPGSLKALRQAVESYVEFEMEHMGREEREILPAALEHLQDEDWTAINAAFADNRDPLFGSERKGAFKSLFSEIAARAPAPHGFGKAS